MLLVYAVALLLGGLFAINAIFAYQSKHIDPAFWSTVWYQFKLLPVMFAANVMIGYGVKFTYKVLNNLTFALSLSKGIEIFVCVAIGFLFLKEVPTWKTLLGLTVVVGGFWISKLK
jgi:drug/metabolite transporter (DMT)-like permease